MTLAILAYLAALSVLLACMAGFYRTNRIAGISACGMVALQIFVRPVLFFLGLDEPSPPEFFERDSWYLVTQGALVGAVWIATLTATYWVIYATVPARGVFPRAPRRMFLVHILIAAALVTAINVLGTLFLIQDAGGVARFQYAVKVEKALAGLYVVRAIGDIALLLCAVAFFTLGTHGESGDPKLRRNLAWLIGAMILANFAINFAWGNRINIALTLLAMFTGWHFAVRRIKLGRTIVWGASALTILFLLRRVRRAWTGEVAGRTVGGDTNFWREASQSLHFSEFDALMLALRDAGRRFDFSYGQEFVNGLLAWVPRFIYSDKKTHIIGASFRQIYQPNVVNGWPVTLPGAWYLNFNVLGLFLGAALSGIFVAMLEKTYADRTSPWNIAMVAMLSFSLLKGGLSFGFFQSYFLTVVPIVLIAMLLTTWAGLSSKQAGAGAPRAPMRLS